MTPADTEQRQNATIPLLTAFIHELNIVRRHLMTYPSGHPMIDAAMDKLLQQSEPLFASRDTLQLGIGKQGLLYEQQWFGQEHPALRDFAASLAQLDIASIQFNGKPDKTELEKLISLMGTEPQIVHAEVGLIGTLEQLQLEKIEITPVDYTAFQTTELDPEQQEQLAETLWDDFLDNLMADSLFSGSSTAKSLKGLELSGIAEILNQNFSAGSSDAQLNEQLIANFIQQLGSLGAFKKKPGQQFFQLIEKLNPELRRQFLNSSFRQLAEHPEVS
jgi:hypothetical protein